MELFNSGITLNSTDEITIASTTKSIEIVNMSHLAVKVNAGTQASTFTLQPFQSKARNVPSEQRILFEIVSPVIAANQQNDEYIECIESTSENETGVTPLAPVPVYTNSSSVVNASLPTSPLIHLGSQQFSLPALGQGASYNIPSIPITKGIYDELFVLVYQQYSSGPSYFIDQVNILLKINSMTVTDDYSKTINSTSNLPVPLNLVQQTSVNSYAKESMLSYQFSDGIVMDSISFQISSGNATNLSSTINITVFGRVGMDITQVQDVSSASILAYNGANINLNIPANGNNYVDIDNSNNHANPARFKAVSAYVKTQSGSSQSSITMTIQEIYANIYTPTYGTSSYDTNGIYLPRTELKYGVPTPQDQSTYIRIYFNNSSASAIVLSQIMVIGWTI